MLSSEYLLKQSEVCLLLAKETTDRHLALKLYELAAKYREMATESGPAVK